LDHIARRFGAVSMRSLGNQRTRAPLFCAAEPADARS